MSKQIEIFPEDKLADDVIVPCPSCGHPIITQHFTKGHVESEYRGAKGECYACAFKKKP